MNYVLDVGGGNFPRGQIVLDISVPSRRLQVKYVTGDACHLPFRSNSFSTIVSYGAINYFSNDMRFLEEAGRVLTNEGVLILSAYTHYSFAINLFYCLKNNPLGALRLILNFLRRRYRWYTLKGLVNKLRSKGFQILGAYPNVTFSWRPTKTPHNLLIIAYRTHYSEVDCPT
jgi:ubiquinone/menaquinone biosynthesis C-methylase UbiE